MKANVAIDKTSYGVTTDGIFGKARKREGFYTDDDVMCLIEALLKKSSLERISAGAKRDIVSSCNTMILAPIQDDVADDSLPKLLEDIKRGIAQKVSQILIPINISNMHWYTLQILFPKPNTLHIIIHDSLIQRGNSAIARSLEQEGSFEISWRAGDLPKIQLGIDNVYCGGYTARLIASLTRAKDAVGLVAWGCEEEKDDKKLRERDAETVNTYISVNPLRFGNQGMEREQVLKLHDKAEKLRDKEIRTIAHEKTTRLRDYLNQANSSNIESLTILLKECNPKGFEILKSDIKGLYKALRVLAEKVEGFASKQELELKRIIEDLFGVLYQQEGGLGCQVWKTDREGDFFINAEWTSAQIVYYVSEIFQVLYLLEREARVIEADKYLRREDADLCEKEKESQSFRETSKNVKKLYGELKRFKSNLELPEWNAEWIGLSLQDVLDTKKFKIIIEEQQRIREEKLQVGKSLQSLADEPQVISEIKRISSGLEKLYRERDANSEIMQKEDHCKNSDFWYPKGYHKYHNAKRCYNKACKEIKDLEKTKKDCEASLEKRKAFKQNLSELDEWSIKLQGMKGNYKFEVDQKIIGRTAEQLKKVEKELQVYETVIESKKGILDKKDAILEAYLRSLEYVVVGTTKLEDGNNKVGNFLKVILGELKKLNLPYSFINNQSNVCLKDNKAFLAELSKVQYRLGVKQADRVEFKHIEEIINAEYASDEIKIKIIADSPILGKSHNIKLEIISGSGIERAVIYEAGGNYLLLKNGNTIFNKLDIFQYLKNGMHAVIMDEAAKLEIEGASSKNLEEMEAGELGKICKGFLLEKELSCKEKEGVLWGIWHRLFTKTTSIMKELEQEGVSKVESGITIHMLYKESFIRVVKQEFARREKVKLKKASEEERKALEGLDTQQKKEWKRYIRDLRSKFSELDRAYPQYKSVLDDVNSSKDLKEALAILGKIIKIEEPSQGLCNKKQDNYDDIKSLCREFLGEPEIAWGTGIDFPEGVLRVKGYNISYIWIAEKIRDKITDELKLQGLTLNQANKLCCVQEDGIDFAEIDKDKKFDQGIKDIIKERIEREYLLDRDEDGKGQERWKNSGNESVSMVMSTLNIDYNDIISIYVKRLELTARAKLYLDGGVNLPGVSLIAFSRGDIIIENPITINTSGRFLGEYKHRKAKSGDMYQFSSRNGDDGLDGRAGIAAGNVTIIARGMIKGKENVQKILAIGSKGMDGQGGGDGATGRDGKAGNNAEADAISMWITNHATYRLAIAHIPGEDVSGKLIESELAGKGGEAGLAGLGGEGGYAGEVLIQDSLCKSDIRDSEKIFGRDILYCTSGLRGGDAPRDSKGGEAGKPGKRGLDQQASKIFSWDVKSKPTLEAYDEDIFDNPEKYTQRAKTFAAEMGVRAAESAASYALSTALFAIPGIGVVAGPLSLAFTAWSQYKNAKLLRAAIYSVSINPKIQYAKDGHSKYLKQLILPHTYAEARELTEQEKLKRDYIRNSTAEKGRDNNHDGQIKSERNRHKAVKADVVEVDYIHQIEKSLKGDVNEDLDAILQELEATLESQEMQEQEREEAIILKDNVASLDQHRKKTILPYKARRLDGVDTPEAVSVLAKELEVYSCTGDTMNGITTRYIRKREREIEKQLSECGISVSEAISTIRLSLDGRLEGVLGHEEVVARVSAYYNKLEFLIKDMRERLVKAEEKRAKSDQISKISSGISEGLVTAASSIVPGGALLGGGLALATAAVGTVSKDSGKKFQALKDKMSKSLSDMLGIKKQAENASYQILWQETEAFIKISGLAYQARSTSNYEQLKELIDNIVKDQKQREAFFKLVISHSKIYEELAYYICVSLQTKEFDNIDKKSYDPSKEPSECKAFFEIIKKSRSDNGGIVDACKKLADIAYTERCKFDKKQKILSIQTSHEFVSFLGDLEKEFKNEKDIIEIITSFTYCGADKAEKEEIAEDQERSKAERTLLTETIKKLDKSKISKRDVYIKVLLDKLLANVNEQNIDSSREALGSDSEKISQSFEKHVIKLYKSKTNAHLDEVVDIVNKEKTRSDKELRTWGKICEFLRLNHKKTVIKQEDFNTLREFHGFIKSLDRCLGTEDGKKELRECMDGIERTLNMRLERELRTNISQFRFHDSMESIIVIAAKCISKNIDDDNIIQLMEFYAHYLTLCTDQSTVKELREVENILKKTTIKLRDKIFSSKGKANLLKTYEYLKQLDNCLVTKHKGGLEQSLQERETLNNYKGKELNQVRETIISEVKKKVGWEEVEEKEDFIRMILLRTHRLSLIDGEEKAKEKLTNLRIQLEQTKSFAECEDFIIVTFLQTILGEKHLIDIADKKTDLSVFLKRLKDRLKERFGQGIEVILEGKESADTRRLLVGMNETLLGIIFNEEEIESYIKRLQLAQKLDSKNAALVEELLKILSKDHCYLDKGYSSATKECRKEAAKSIFFIRSQILYSVKHKILNKLDAVYQCVDVSNEILKADVSLRILSHLDSSLLTAVPNKTKETNIELVDKVLGEIKDQILLETLSNGAISQALRKEWVGLIGKNLSKSSILELNKGLDIVFNLRNSLRAPDIFYLEGQLTAAYRDKLSGLYSKLMQVGNSQEANRAADLARITNVLNVSDISEFIVYHTYGNWFAGLERGEILEPEGYAINLVSKINNEKYAKFDDIVGSFIRSTGEQDIRQKSQEVYIALSLMTRKDSHESSINKIAETLQTIAKKPEDIKICILRLSILHQCLIYIYNLESQAINDAPFKRLEDKIDYQEKLNLSSRALLWMQKKLEEIEGISYYLPKESKILEYEELKQQIIGMSQVLLKQVTERSLRNFEEIGGKGSMLSIEEKLYFDFLSRTSHKFKLNPYSNLWVSDLKKSTLENINSGLADLSAELKAEPLGTLKEFNDAILLQEIQEAFKALPPTLQRQLTTIKQLKIDLHKSHLMAEANGELSLWLEFMQTIKQIKQAGGSVEEVSQIIEFSFYLENLGLANELIGEGGKDTALKDRALTILLTALINKLECLLGEDEKNNQALKDNLLTLEKIIADSQYKEQGKQYLLLILQEVSKAIHNQSKFSSFAIKLENVIDLTIDTNGFANPSIMQKFIEKGIRALELELKKEKVQIDLGIKDENVGSLWLLLESEKGRGLLEKLKVKIKGATDKAGLKEILRKLNSNAYILDSEVVDSLTKNIAEWSEKFAGHTAKKRRGEERSIKELVSIIREEEHGINASIAELLGVSSDDAEKTKVESLLTLISERSKLPPEKHKSAKASKEVASQRSKSSRKEKCIEQYSAEDVKAWSQAFRTNGTQVLADDECKIEMFAMLDRAVKLFAEEKKTLGWDRVRNVQKLAVLGFLVNEGRGSKVANIYTGEGKSLITALLAIARVLRGERVDILTSSRVLAERDSYEWAKLYDLFNISVSNNCDEEASKSELVRRDRYKQCSIIYGDLGSFQKDYLLSKYFNRDIREGGVGTFLIIDEADNMLIDNAANTLYISHSIEDLNHLKDIFLVIWAYVKNPENVEYTKDREQAIKQELSNQQENGLLAIPSHLKNFVNKRLGIWVWNAYQALYMRKEDQYSVLEHGVNAGNVVIMDIDTGVEQFNTNWSNGLQQFIQLKHANKLTAESLKAIFISNLEYFKLYESKINGFTGTLGCEDDLELMNKVYGLSFMRIPRFKAERYIHRDDLVCKDEQAWFKGIATNLDKTIGEGRAALIICENKLSAKKIASTIVAGRSYYRYVGTVDHIEQISSEGKVIRSGVDVSDIKLQQRDIVISTNIAGRGADFATDTKLNEVGGLHVMLTYEPNGRVRKQAFGRTARQGNNGSGQSIVMDFNNRSILELREDIVVAEASRLEEVTRVVVPRLDLEGELLKQLWKLQEEYKPILEARYVQELHQGINLLNFLQEAKEKQDKYVELQMLSLHNKWAFWLDSVQELIGKVYNDNVRRQVFSEFFKFKEAVVSAYSVNKFGFIDEPGELIKLAKYYINNKFYKEAVEVAQEIIKEGKASQDYAYYYQAIGILGGTIKTKEEKRLVKKTLKTAAYLFEERVGRLRAQGEVMQVLRDSDIKSGLGAEVDKFTESNATEIVLVQTHINAIYRLLGTDFRESTIKSGVILDDEHCKSIYAKVMQEKKTILKARRVSKKLRVKWHVESSREELDKLEMQLEIDTVKGNYLVVSELNQIQHKWLEDKGIKISKELYLHDQYKQKDTLIIIPMDFIQYKDFIIESIEAGLQNAQDARIATVESISSSILSKNVLWELIAPLTEQVKVLSIGEEYEKVKMGEWSEKEFKGCGSQLKGDFEQAISKIKKEEQINPELLLKKHYKEAPSYEVVKKLLIAKGIIRETWVTKFKPNTQEAIEAYANSILTVNTPKKKGYSDNQELCQLLIGAVKYNFINSLKESGEISLDKSGLKPKLFKELRDRLHLLTQNKDDNSKSIVWKTWSKVKDQVLTAPISPISFSPTEHPLDQIAKLLDEKIKFGQDIKLIDELSAPALTKISKENLFTYGIGQQMVEQVFVAIKNIIEETGRHTQKIKLLEELLSLKWIKSISDATTLVTVLLDLSKLNDITKEAITYNPTQLLNSLLGQKVIKEAKVRFDIEANKDTIRERLATISDSIKDSYFKFFVPILEKQRDGLISEKEIKQEIESLFDNVVLMQAVRGNYKGMQESYLTAAQNSHIASAYKAIQKLDQTASTMSSIASSISTSIASGTKLLSGVLTGDSEISSEEEEKTTQGAEIRKFIIENIDPSLIKMQIEEMLYYKHELEQRQEIQEKFLQYKEAQSEFVRAVISLGEKATGAVVSAQDWLAKEGEKFHSILLGKHSEETEREYKKLCLEIKEPERQLEHLIKQKLEYKAILEKAEKYSNSIVSSIQSTIGELKKLPKLKLSEDSLKKHFQEKGEIPPELREYISRAQDIVLASDLYKEWIDYLDKRAAIVATAGVIQISAGVALTVSTVGFLYHLGGALVSEGVSDIMFAMQTGVSGTFTWESYLDNKWKSALISLATAGIGAWASSGANVASISKNFTGVIGGQAALCGGKAAAPNLILAIAKTAAVEVAQATLSGIVSKLLDETTGKLVEFILDQFSSDFERVVKNLAVYQRYEKNFEVTLKKIYSVYTDEEAEQLIESKMREVIENLHSGPGKEVLNKALEFTQSLSKQLGSAAERLKYSSNAKVQTIGQVMSVLDTFVKVAEVANIIHGMATIMPTSLSSINEKVLAEYDGTRKLSIREISQEAISKQKDKVLKSCIQEFKAYAHKTIQKTLIQRGINSLVQQITAPIFEGFTRDLKELKERQLLIGQHDYLTANATRNSSYINEKTMLEKELDELSFSTTVYREGLSAKNLSDESIKSRKVIDPESGQLVNLSDLTNVAGKGLMLVQGQDGELYAARPWASEYIRSSITRADPTNSLVMSTFMKVSGQSFPVVDENGQIIATGSDQRLALMVTKPNGKGEIGHAVPCERIGNRWVPIEGFERIMQASGDKDCGPKAILFLAGYKQKDVDQAVTQANDDKAVNSLYSNAQALASVSPSFKSQYHARTHERYPQMVVGGHIRDIATGNIANEWLLANGAKKIHATYERVEGKKDVLIENGVIVELTRDANQGLHKAMHLRDSILSKLRVVGVRENEDGKITSVVEVMVITNARDPEQLLEIRISTSAGDIDKSSLKKIQLEIQKNSENAIIKPSLKVISNNSTPIYRDGFPLKKSFSDGSSLNVNCARTKQLNLPTYAEHETCFRVGGEFHLKRVGNHIKPWIKANSVMESCGSCREHTKNFSAKKTHSGNVSSLNSRKVLTEYWLDYNEIALKSLLELRLKSKVGDMPVFRGIKILEARIIDHTEYLKAQLDALTQEIYFNYMGGKSVILVPLLIPESDFVYHWVGLALTKKFNELIITYLDSENRLANPVLSQQLPQKLQNIFPKRKVSFQQMPMEQQRYNNCGPELVENFVCYLTGKRVSQEEAVPLHTYLWQQDLLLKECSKSSSSVISSKDDAQLDSSYTKWLTSKVGENWGEMVTSSSINISTITYVLSACNVKEVFCKGFKLLLSTWLPANSWCNAPIKILTPETGVRNASEKYWEDYIIMQQKMDSDIGRHFT